LQILAGALGNVSKISFGSSAGVARLKRTQLAGLLISFWRAAYVYLNNFSARFDSTLGVWLLECVFPQSSVFTIMDERERAHCPAYPLLEPAFTYISSKLIAEKRISRVINSK